MANVHRQFLWIPVIQEKNFVVRGFGARQQEALVVSVPLLLTQSPLAKVPTRHKTFLLNYGNKKRVNEHLISIVYTSTPNVYTKNITNTPRRAKGGFLMLLLGSHVGMSGKDMLVNSVKEALSYDANTFMVYTGAPQNTRRKDISELCIPQARKLMEEHNMANFIVHAPYIINLANTVKPETYELAATFLAKEIERTAAMGATVLVLHPGAHVGAGAEAGIAQICKGLNEVLNEDTPVFIALETMAGKGTEIGRSFEELKAIYDGCNHPDKLRVCFDTCHVNDAGYDLVNDYENVMKEFDKIIGLDQIAAFHINDSKNPLGAAKDRHENFGKGYLGSDALMQVIRDSRFETIPKILETPYIKDPENPKKSTPPYKEEIAWIKKQLMEG